MGGVEPALRGGCTPTPSRTPTPGGTGGRHNVTDSALGPVGNSRRTYCRNAVTPAVRPCSARQRWNAVATVTSSSIGSITCRSRLMSGYVNERGLGVDELRAPLPNPDRPLVTPDRRTTRHDPPRPPWRHTSRPCPCPRRHSPQSGTSICAHTSAAKLSTTSITSTLLLAVGPGLPLGSPGVYRDKEPTTRTRSADARHHPTPAG